MKDKRDDNWLDEQLNKAIEERKQYPIWIIKTLKPEKPIDTEDYD